jgi:hypothetical protein
MSSDAAPTPGKRSESEEEDALAIEANTHAFVVKLWLEEAKAPRAWRGHVTHVVTGDRKHISHTDQIAAFIDRYL